MALSTTIKKLEQDLDLYQKKSQRLEALRKLESHLFSMEKFFTKPGNFKNASRLLSYVINESKTYQNEDLSKNLYETIQKVIKILEPQKNEPEIEAYLKELNDFITNYNKEKEKKLNRYKPTPEKKARKTSKRKKANA